MIFPKTKAHLFLFIRKRSLQERGVASELEAKTLLILGARFWSILDFDENRKKKSKSSILAFGEDQTRIISLCIKI